MRNTFTIPKCLQNCKICCVQIKNQRKDGKDGKGVAKIDQFWKDLVRRTVCGFYKRKLAPTLHTLDFINQNIITEKKVPWKKRIKQPLMLQGTRPIFLYQRSKITRIFSGMDKVSQCVKFYTFKFV